MSMNKRGSFKLSITNLVLVNEVYPFDFFLRIRAGNSEQYQDSPIILAHQGECEQLFPWEFAISKSQIRVQFVEISTNTRVEIQRGQFYIEGLTDEDGQTVAILANRTAKKLCLITYILSTYQPRQRGIQQSHLDESYKSEEQKEEYKQKSSRNFFPKNEQQELSQQIAQINRSIDKILSHEKNEHAIFNKYLNESTSFIREMMNNSKQNGISRAKDLDDSELQQNSNKNNSILKEISENQQNQNDEINSKRWYKENYQKDQPQILSNRDYRKDSISRKSALDLSITYDKQENLTSICQQKQSSIILNEIWFNTEIKPNEVSFIEYPTKSQILKMKTLSEGTYSWKNPIQVPNLPALIVKATENNKIQLQGFIAKKQLEKGKVYLFDEKGQHKGFMKFKHKILNVYCVQTQQILDSNQIQNTQKQQEPKNKDDFETFKVQKKERSSKRGSKLQKAVQQQKETSNKQQLRYQNSKNNRYDLASNQFAISYLPFMKKEAPSEKEQNHRTSFMSESRFSSASSSQFISRVKLVNLKIDTISVKLQKNNNEFVGKFIKLSMRNKQPITTQTINLSQNLTWKGKGYVFDNISPFAQLKVELCNDENNNQTTVGTAKVCLALLNLHKQKTVQFYHEYLRDENENQVGELILGYESIDKKKDNKVSSVNRFRDDGLSEQDEINAEIRDPISTSKRKRRIKTKSNQKVKPKAKAIFPGSEPTNRTQKKNNIGVHGSQANSLVGGTSAIRAKKYTGGNIIIGRAARFTFESNRNKLGPGEYEVPSTFQRHVEPT